MNSARDGGGSPPPAAAARTRPKRRAEEPVSSLSARPYDLPAPPECVKTRIAHSRESWLFCHWGESRRHPRPLFTPSVSSRPCRPEAELLRRREPPFVVTPPSGHGGIRNRPADRFTFTAHCLGLDVGAVGRAVDRRWLSVSPNESVAGLLRHCHSTAGVAPAPSSFGCQPPSLNSREHVSPSAASAASDANRVLALPVVSRATASASASFPRYSPTATLAVPNVRIIGHEHHPPGNSKKINRPCPASHCRDGPPRTIVIVRPTSAFLVGGRREVDQSRR